MALTFLPVARGGGPNVREGLSELFTLPPSEELSFHAITSSGISERNLDGGLYVGAPHEERYSARET